jgi:hypothetical protein
MKRLIFFFAILPVLLSACNIPNPGTQPTLTAPPVANATSVSATMPIVPGPSVTTNLTCNELAVYLDPALASGTKCETIAESAEGMEIYPQYTRLTLQGYVLSGKFFSPQISVFPVQRYNELLSGSVIRDTRKIQALIGGAAADDSLPFLPTLNAAQVFNARYQVLPFASGGGIRYLTEYAQYFAPVNNTDLIYTYQGLTSDGKNWVSAILPINNPILPADAVNPPGGISWEEFSNNYQPYITDMINQLNSQPSGNYTPTLAALDALVASITIQP